MMKQIIFYILILISGVAISQEYLPQSGGVITITPNILDKPYMPQLWREVQVDSNGIITLPHDYGIQYLPHYIYPEYEYIIGRTDTVKIIMLASLCDTCFPQVVRGYCIREYSLFTFPNSQFSHEMDVNKKPFPKDVIVWIAKEHEWQ